MQPRTIIVAIFIVLLMRDGSGLALAAGGQPSVAIDGNVRSFGAVGDGQANDTAAIQQAIDSKAGLIQFPKGIYRITKTIVIDLDRVGPVSISGGGVARVVMAGAGPALRFVGTHMKSADPRDFAKNVLERQRMPLVDAIAIDGGHPEAVAIEAVGTMELTITRVHVRSVLHCIHLVGNNRNVIISECHLYENRGIGIFYDNVNLHQSNIIGCHISYNQGGGIVSRGGNVRNIHVSGCDIEDNMSPKAPPTANFLIDCTGSNDGTGEVAITGCTIQHDGSSPDSANIRIIGRANPTPKLALVREGHVTITGNVLSDVKVNVHLKDCRGVVLTGNTFWMGYTHNLLVEDCSDIIIGPNNFDRNPLYNYGNSLDTKNSLVVRNCEDCTLSGLHITNVWREPAGLLIENCRRMNITDCTILDCDNVGLLLRDVTNSRVSGCLIRDDRPDVKSATLVLTAGKGNMIVNNLLGAAPHVAENAARMSGNVYP